MKYQWKFQTHIPEERRLKYSKANGREEAKGDAKQQRVVGLNQFHPLA